MHEVDCDGEEAFYSSLTTVFFKMIQKPKIVVVLGPTASGKSTLAVQLAKKFNGEIISADSRQVYKGLTIGTGKISKKEMGGVQHHLLDVASPKKRFTVVQYRRLADKAIADILRRGRLPIVCGGTGFYLQAIVDGIALPEVLPSEPLRKELQNKTTKELFQRLVELDAHRAETIDSKNARRLIRAIEIATALGTVPPVTAKPLYDVLQIGINLPQEMLKTRIYDRLRARIRAGMVAEADRLHQGGISWKRMDELGLEYRYLALFLQKKRTKEEVIERLNSEIWHYAKRQMTWWKRDARIVWFKSPSLTQITKTVSQFLRS